jgi:hypothetical protein
MPKAVQVAHPPFIQALAVEAYASTARAGARCLQHLEVNPHLRVALHPDDAVSRER